MGLFGKKKKEDASENRDGAMLQGGASVEPISKNSEELQSLLNEFREMKEGASNRVIDEGVQEAEEIIEEIVDEHEGGEEYEVSESESESIEDFLSAGDEYEEEYMGEPYEEEPVEEEVIEEEPIEEEPIEEAYNAEEESIEEDSYEDEVAVDVDIKIPQDDISDDELDDDAEIVEEEVFEEASVDEVVEEEHEETIEEEPAEHNEDEQASAVEEMKKALNEAKADFVTSEDIDKKFDDFEKRLLEKLMMQFSKMQPVAAVSPSAPVQKKETQVLDEEELQIETIDGKLTINGYTFTGEVVMFTPISSLKKASWEEVVRRKGHCTYHLTTSGNGGWFIKKSNAPNPYAYIEKKEEAEELAKFYAKHEKAELKIHNNKGVIEKSLSFGREKLRG